MGPVLNLHQLTFYQELQAVCILCKHYDFGIAILVRDVVHLLMRRIDLAENSKDC